MTVAELIAALSALSDEYRDRPVEAIWDCTAGFPVHSVHELYGHVFIDCGNSPEGDWETFYGDVLAGRSWFSDLENKP